MMRNSRFLVTIICALIALPASAQSITPPSPSQNTAASSTSQLAGDVEHGHLVFLTDGCSECHGTVGEGGAAGPRIAPNPMEADAIAGYIRDPRGVMPPYSASVLNDRAVQEIQAYLASLPQPPGLASIPALNQQ